jgi:hypothetical protein
MNTTFGIIINNVKYIYVHEKNELKHKSLENNVYFTLRDISRNASNSFICFQVNEFNDALTGGIYLDDRIETFNYTNALQDKEYVEKLIAWLNRVNEDWFAFLELEESYDYKNGKISMCKYIQWEIWFVQLKQFIQSLIVHYETL